MFNFSQNIVKFGEFATKQKSYTFCKIFVFSEKSEKIIEFLVKPNVTKSSTFQKKSNFSQKKSNFSQKKSNFSQKKSNFSQKSFVFSQKSGKITPKCGKITVFRAFFSENVGKLRDFWQNTGPQRGHSNKSGAIGHITGLYWANRGHRPIKCERIRKNGAIGRSNVREFEVFFQNWVQSGENVEEFRFWPDFSRI